MIEVEQQERLPAYVDLISMHLNQRHEPHGLANCPKILTPADIASAFSPIAALPREVFIAGLLNAQHLLVAWQIISIGAENRVSVGVRELFKLALETEDHQICLAYNRTGAKGLVGQANLEYAADVAAAANILDVSLFDIVQLCRNGHVSVMSLLRASQESIPSGDRLIACA